MLTVLIGAWEARMNSAMASGVCSVSVSKPVTAAYLQQQDEASLKAFSTASRVSPVRF